MRRLLCTIALGAILLLHSGAALAAPTPSPGLDGILLKPPGVGYKEEPKAGPGIVEGPFDAAKYAEVTGASDAGQSLIANGFLAGYGRHWSTAGSAHVFAEAVLSFSGAKGAKAWLRLEEAADKADPTFTQALTLPSIDTYYGARLVDKVHKVYGDAFGFAKGNDVVLVTYISNKNDLASIAATQTKRQYDATPPYTIPASQWPENKVVASSPFNGLKTIGIVIGILILLALIGAGGVYFWMRRRPAQAIPLQDPPGFVSGTSITQPAPMTPPAMAVPMAGGPGGAAPPIQEGPFVMSEDRLSWWDGAAWRNAEHEVPPTAQRSEDGQFWWDGEAWRGMPAGPFAG